MEDFEARVAWNALKPRTTREDVIEAGKTEVYLQGVSTQVQPGDAILIVGQERENDPGSERWDVRIVQTVESHIAGNYTRVMWDEGLGLVVQGNVVVQPAASATAKVYVFRQRAAIFGYNAPDWRAMSNDIKLSYGASTDSRGNITTTEWPGFELADEIDPENPQLHLDLVYPKILVESWVALSQPAYTELYRAIAVVQSSRTDFTLTSKTTLITLDTAESLTDRFNDQRRATVVYAQSEELARAERPLSTPVEGNTIELDGLVEGLGPGQAIIVSGKLSAADEPETSEVAFVAFTIEDDSRTTIILDNGLEHSYVRATVTIYANVVRATHGETTREALGSGNGAMTNQQFALKKSPLTYVSAATASGSESTLDIRVNAVQWQQVASLYGQPAAGKDSQVYSVRLDDDGVSTVIFGDGTSGARLPTGQENLQATYRVGIGTVGEVGAHRLTLLKTRPFGIRSVTNPIAASGAADPEILDAARSNAPMTVLTLDRVVSLQDFEDFARAFAGIGKAQAVNIWNGETFLVHITIADDNGDQVPTTSDLFTNLCRAIDAARDPTAQVVIASFESLSFNLAATVMYDPAYLPEAVRARVEAALHNAFAFARRAFGQPVTAAEVISVIQQSEGVVAVDLDALHISTENPGLAAVLPARTARRDNGAILPAQLLLLNASGISITMRAV
jgi:predicted phage baseplate assembly protein